MSDTVKLIIEIPKVPKNDHERWGLEHGIPLDTVKAEIEEMPTEKIARCRKAYIFASEFKTKVLEILDNIDKAESEDK